MTSLTQPVIAVLATGTLILNILTVIFIFLLVLSVIHPKNNTVKKITKGIFDNYTLIVLGISAIATAGSLSLSEILNFIPCKLCWYQRIAMYPQAAIAFIALLKNDPKIKQYIIPLSVIGILISSYHILLQMFPNAFQCNDEVAKCSAVQFTQYGYITIPVMAFSAFLFLIVISLIKSSKEK